jgi:hypothetical protein
MERLDDSEGMLVLLLSVGVVVAVEVMDCRSITLRWTVLLTDDDEGDATRGKTERDENAKHSVLVTTANRAHVRDNRMMAAAAWYSAKNVSRVVQN